MEQEKTFANEEAANIFARNFDGTVTADIDQYGTPVRWTVRWTRPTQSYTQSSSGDGDAYAGAIDPSGFTTSPEEILAAGQAGSAADFDAIRQYYPRLAQIGLDVAEDVAPRAYALQADLLRDYLPQFTTAMNDANTAERQAGLQDVINFGSLVQEGREASEDPQMTALRNALLGRATSDLALGQQLSPEERRAAEQNVRASQFSRGLGRGQGSALRESVYKSLAGRDLENTRFSRAQSLYGLESQLAPSPFDVVLGMGSGAAGGAFNLFGAVNQVPTAGGTPQPSAVGTGLVNTANTGLTSAGNLAAANNSAVLRNRAIDLYASNPDVASSLDLGSL